ncbi:hypothetical protein [Sulfitobacter pontiacus]|uniref:hypothetical protein n=1 Tax=Sulfitobacter pontiacus TaxID=60137 RepID=UPI0030EFA5A4
MWKQPDDPHLKRPSIVLAFVVYIVFLGGLVYSGSGLQALALVTLATIVAGLWAQGRMCRLGDETAEDGIFETRADDASLIHVRHSGTYQHKFSGLMTLSDLRRTLTGAVAPEMLVTLHHAEAHSEVIFPLDRPENADLQDFPEQIRRSLSRLADVITPCRFRGHLHEATFHIHSLTDHPLLVTGTVAEQAELLQNLDYAVKDYGLGQELSVVVPLSPQDFVMALDHGHLTAVTEGIVTVLEPAAQWPG